MYLCCCGLLGCCLLVFFFIKENLSFLEKLATHSTLEKVQMKRALSLHRLNKTVQEVF